MGDKTAIEWTDATWNPVTGCTKLSQGCKNCYAERVFPRAYGKQRKFTEVVCHPDRLDQPLRWKKPRRIFVNSMSDLFHEDVPEEFIAQVWKTMFLSPKHTFQILTKRAERMLYILKHLGFNGEKFMPGAKSYCCEMPNVHLGVSCEDQETADERIPLLLQTPAAVRFVSAEPLLGPIDLTCIAAARIAGGKFGQDVTDQKYQSIGWIIVGGESGPNARPMHPSWARSLRDQCQTAGVAFFLKQWGEWIPAQSTTLYPVKFFWNDGVIKDDYEERQYPGLSMHAIRRVGKKAAGAVLDGKEWKEFPA